MKKNYTLVAAAGLAAAVALTGCSGAGDGSDSGSVTLTYWMTGTDDDAKSMTAAADLYHKDNPDVTIKVQAVPWADAHAKILSAATSGSGPDLISGGMSWGIEFGGKGGMVDLSSYEIDDIKKATPSGIWNSIVDSKGKVYAVPLDIATSAYLYRPDLLQKAGIAQPPATWDDLLADIPKLQATGVTYPFVENWGTFSVQDYANYLFQAGGDFYTKGCKAGGLDSTAAKKALTMWAKVFSGSTPKQNIDGASALLDGSAAIVQDESGSLKLYDTRVPGLAGKWSLGPIPAGPDGISSFVGGRVTGVMAGSSHKDQAAAFIKFLSTPEAIAALQKQAAANGSLWVPASTDAVQGLDIPADQKKILADSIEKGNAGPNCNGWGDAAGDVGNLLQSVVTDKADPDTVLKKANELLNAGL